MTRARPLLRLAYPCAVLALFTLPGAAQQANPAVQGNPALDAARAVLATETYVAPPPAIARLVAAPRHLNVSLTQPSPDRKRFLKEESEGLPPVSLFGQPHYYFAGLQVDPTAYRERRLTTRGGSGLQLIDATTGVTTSVQTPNGASVSNPVWSPDGAQLAFLANFEAATHVYVADAATGRARQVTRTPLLATLVTRVDWTADGGSIVAVLLPEPRGPVPARPAVAVGPQVRLWMDSLESPQRNWWSLLQDPYEQDLMEHYTTGQLALIDVRSRAVTRIGQPAMITAVDASPRGRYFRVTTMRRPFSYVVQYSNFGRVEELWDGEGKVVAEIEDRPLREARDTTDDNGPGTNRDGAKRGLAWMPDGNGMYFLEPVPRARRGADSADADAPAPAARGGTGTNGPGRADRLVQWLPPFGPENTRVLYTGEGSISSVLFSDDATTVFVATSRSGTGELFAVNLAQPETRTRILRQRAWTPSFSVIGTGGGFGGGGGGRGVVGADDSLAFYHNPGAMLGRRGTMGGSVAMVSSDGAVFLRGTRYFKEWMNQPPLVFVDRVEIATGARARVYESAPNESATLTAALDDDFTRAVVIRETPDMVPNSYLLDVTAGSYTKLTDNADRMPEFTSAIRKRIFVTRADGIKFLVKLTLPADYQAGTRLPGMLWLYPYEYTDQAGYDRRIRTEDINSFPNGGTRTIEYLVTQGYAVANFNPPIIGDQGRMNDSYVPDLRMNLAAVIDELDRHGYIDRNRLAIGGHSYGAFSTANAMVQTPFFKAGIAGDGMYNRTLTPNGFQSERRDLWSGQRTYLEMSPMLFAERLQGALLMYHSMEDQNTGTDLISSIRMMQALRAHGKTASLFMYPYEDHGPAARETLLDLWARWTAWLDIYVKHAGQSLSKKEAVIAAEPAEPSP